MTAPPLGSLAWCDWRQSLTGQVSERTTEHGLFTDSVFPGLGELRLEAGPFVVLGSWLGPGVGSAAPRGFLRVRHYTDPESFNPTQPSADRFHGGRIADEFAAFLALELGIRLQAGPPQREFMADGDPLGQPTSSVPPGQTVPFLQPRQSASMLPRFGAFASFSEVLLLTRIPELNAEQSIAVARCSRLYQDAVWVADHQPWLSWLLLVSAAEVAAQRWAKSQFSDSIDNLQDSRPDLVTDLESSGLAGAVPVVAQHLAGVTGATRRFREFLLAFVPPAPSIRSVPGTTCEWTPQSLGQAFRAIYTHRSQALHGGKPFPSVLCLAPLMLDGVPAERPTSTGVATQQSSWTPDELPFHLHIFEHIVRHALLAWWQSLLGQE